MFYIYGMSFCNHIADHLEQLDSRLAGQRFAGPPRRPMAGIFSTLFFLACLPLNQLAPRLEPLHA